ncbi:MAG: multicopper oxidase domain-containing protein [Ilumatobacteraceae bacterium]
MQRQDRSVLGWLALAVAVGALFVGLFSLRDNNTSGGSAAGEGGGGGATSVTVTVTEFKFSPNSLSISTEGGTIKIVNSGTAAHNLSIPQLGLKSEDVQPGATGELKVGKNAAGSYEVLCEIPGHADSGMTGTISVGGSGGGEAVAAGTDTGAHAVDGATMTPAQNAAMDARMLAVAQAYPAKTEGIGGKILEPTIETIDGHETKVYDLEAKIVDWEVSPGKTVKAWTYNGVVPGPELVWKKGDYVQVNFTNNLPQSTSIHFHGIRVPNGMDGVDPYTQPPTEPGGTFVYKFQILEDGNGIYHSHHNAQEQIPNGMFGSILVGEMPIPQMLQDLGYTKVDKRVTMVLNDAGVIGLSLNGKSFPATEPYTLRIGQVMEVTYQNEGLMGHPMHLHQPMGWVIAKDGKPMPAPIPGDTFWVSPGERYTVLYKGTDPGVWAWHCHILNHAEGPNGMFGMVTALIVER